MASLSNCFSLVKNLGQSWLEFTTQHLLFEDPINGFINVWSLFQKTVNSQPTINSTSATWKGPFYLTTNERHEHIYKVINEKPRKYNTIAGVSGFFILNVLAARSKQQAFDFHLVILDSSPKVEKAWKFLREMLLETDNRRRALENIGRHFYENKNFYFSEAFNSTSPQVFYERRIATFNIEIKNQESWSSSDQVFQLVRNVFLQKRFIFYKVDLTNEKAIQKISKDLKNKNLKLDLFYASNVHEAVYTKKYFQAISHLMQTETHIIHTKFRKCSTCDLTQKVSTYTQYLQEKTPNCCTHSGNPYLMELPKVQYINTQQRKIVQLLQETDLLIQCLQNTSDKQTQDALKSQIEANITL